jgi:hypothetical protein
MLWKMLVHGLLAAILIGSAAAVYAQAKDTGHLSQTAPQAGTGTAGTADGYVRPAAAEARKDGERNKHSRDDRDDDRDHDDDHDD